MRQEIRISGFGGQGVGLAGFILGKALALYEEGEAVMTQSYGPEARGGASSTNVVFSDREIAYPFVQRPDILVTLSQEAYTTYRPQAKDDAIVLIDADLVTPFDGDRVHAIPATRLAEEMGRRIVANMIMLGFFTAVTGLVSRESMQKALESSVKPKTAPLNLQAFNLGYEYQPEKEQAA
ncbi:MAG: 2-oxoacid:acceptor oxidoreductase family protein [Anaerolineales bacterium]|nr:2-oxoacid:acceptor oxidoreductase family protein [Anaerolineales bacterium]